MANVNYLGSYGDGSNSSLMFRNKIINGDMRIDQRNSGLSVAANSAYTLDRWAALNSAAPSFTIQQNAGAVTPPVGFTNYLGCTVVSAITPGTSQRWSMQQSVEGFNVADLAWGTANAKTVTLSFWVRSSLTGVFGGAIRNSAGNRSYPFTYSISAANTWEQKSVTIVGDTSGTWLTNNGVGLSLVFSLGAGATLSGTAGAWAGSDLWSATGATNVISTNGATLYITGVQLEAGAQATPFEQRPIGLELSLCQRYYSLVSSCSLIASVADAAVGTIQFPVTMRVAPALDLTAPAQISDTQSDKTQSSKSINVTGSNRINNQSANITLANFSGLTVVRPQYFISSAASITCSAEL